MAFLSEIHAKHVDLYLHQQGMDTTTPAGKALFQMMGVFAEFERTMIQERVKAGLERAKAQGKRLGRPTMARFVAVSVPVRGSLCPAGAGLPQVHAAWPQVRRLGAGDGGRPWRGGRAAEVANLGLCGAPGRVRVANLCDQRRPLRVSSSINASVLKFGKARLHGQRIAVHWN